MAGRLRFAEGSIASNDGAPLAWSVELFEMEDGTYEIRVEDDVHDRHEVLVAETRGDALDRYSVTLQEVATTEPP